MNISYLRNPQWDAMSATDRNFKARANSKKPSMTFTLFIQPPDLGNELSQEGKMANRPNGIANASEKPAITIAGPRVPSDDASTNADPIKGPVHENETIASVAAIKKIPSKPPLSASASLLLLQLLGSVIS